MNWNIVLEYEARAEAQRHVLPSPAWRGELPADWKKAPRDFCIQTHCAQCGGVLMLRCKYTTKKIEAIGDLHMVVCSHRGL